MKHKIQTGELEGERQLGARRSTYKNNIKMGVYGIDLAQDRGQCNDGTLM
jgi:hypothetical protein